MAWAARDSSAVLASTPLLVDLLAAIPMAVTQRNASSWKLSRWLKKLPKLGQPISKKSIENRSKSIVRGADLHILSLFVLEHPLVDFLLLELLNLHLVFVKVDLLFSIVNLSSLVVTVKNRPLKQ